MEKPEIKFINFSIDAKSAVPVYQQVKHALKRFIASGYLKQGDQLISIREMASRHNIHPNTIIKVYSQLEREGYITSKQGSGFFVCVEEALISREKEAFLEEAANEFHNKVLQLGYSMDDIIPLLRKIERRASMKEKTARDVS
ncbi:MAG: GntR family transcriptional regulator [Candidatus Aminicenantes bacterium]|nr:GntR family transcriptional regulator [Candidatus Aminicenantes bacterium]